MLNDALKEGKILLTQSDVEGDIAAALKREGIT